MFRRLVLLAPAAAALLFALAAPASAHVTVNPSEAVKGSYTKLTFRVPNERPDASTTKLEVKLPEDHPLESVSVKPVPGWTATVAASVITWTGGEVKPGEFQEFDVSVGPLPEDTDRLVFPAVQTYSSGEVVSWSELHEEGAEEPEHPAPVLKLIDAPEADGDSGKGIATVALVVGALGLLAGTGGLALGRRAGA